MPFRRIHRLIGSILRIMSSDRVPAGLGESSSADWVQAATFAIQDSPQTGLPTALIRKIDLQHLRDATDGMSEIPICPPGSGQWLPEGPYAAVLFGPGKQVFCYRFGRRLAGVDGVLFALDESDVSADPMLLEDRLMSVLVALEQAFEMEGELSIHQGSTAQAEPFRREMESFRIHALYEISTRSGLSVDGRVREMLHLCAQMMGLEKGRVLEFDHPNHALRTLVSTETNGPAPIEPMQGTFAEAVLHAGTVLTTDSSHYADISGSQFAVGAPFRVHGSVQGCIVLSTARSRTSELETEDRSFLELVARWFGSQSENRRVESFIDSFFNVAGDLLCILDETGQAIKLNQAWEKNTGFTEQEILKRPMADFLAPGEGSAFDDALEEARNFGIARGLDNRFIVRGGAVRWLSWTIRFDRETNVFFAAARDVTESRQNEIRIIEYNERLNAVNRIARFIAEDRSINDIIGFALDSLASMFPDYRICYGSIDSGKMAHIVSVAGRSWAALKGECTDLAMAKSYLEKLSSGHTIRLSDARTDSLVQGIRSMINKGMIAAAIDVPLIQGGELTGLLSMHGQHPHIWSRHETLTLEEMGRALSAAIASQKHKEELVRARDLADAANRAKTEFLANMSHELRTPLHAIIGMSDLLSGQSMTAEQHQFVSVIRKAGDSLLGIISDILDLTQIEADRLPLKLVDFEIPTMMSEVVRLSGGQERSELEMRIELEESVPEYAKGDSARLRQVLLNVIGNAVKFTPGGLVRISVGSLPSTHIVEGRPGIHADLVGRPVWRSLTIQVIDSGVGIPESKQTEIFETFHQADNARTRPYGGTGLGLSLSRRLMEKMGGTIRVTSPGPGQGSTFTLELPLFQPGD